MSGCGPSSQEVDSEMRPEDEPALSARVRRRRPRWFLPVRLGVIAFLILMCCFVAYRQMVQTDLLKRLTGLEPAEVRQITISQDRDLRDVRVIEDQVLIREFIEACRDAQIFAPNHPSYQSTWIVTIQAKEALQLECSYEVRHSDLVIGSFIQASHSSTSYYGSFSSRRLRVWFDRHVLGSETSESLPARGDG